MIHYLELRLQFDLLTELGLLSQGRFVMDGCQHISEILRGNELPTSIPRDRFPNAVTNVGSDLGMSRMDETG